MNVEGPAPIVPLGDAGEGEVGIEALNHLFGNVQEWRLGWELRRAGAGLLLGEPAPQVGGKVRPQWYLRRFAVLRVPGRKQQHGPLVVEHRVGHREPRQLTTPQPREDQRLVEDRPMPAPVLKLGKRLRVAGEPLPRAVDRLGEVLGRQRGELPGIPLPLLLALRLRHGEPASLRQWPPRRGVDESLKLLLVHRPASAANVDPLVELRNRTGRVRGEAVMLDAPKAEAPHRLQVAVAGSWAAPRGGEFPQPLLNWTRRKVPQHPHPAGREHLLRQPLAVCQMLLAGGPLAVLEVGQILGERPFDRRGEPVPHGVVGLADDAGADILGAAYEVAEHRLRGVLRSASGRDFADDARAVAVLGDVRCRLDANPQRPVAPFDDGARAAFPLPVPPAGDSLPLAGGSLGPLGEGAGDGFTIDGSQDSFLPERSGAVRRRFGGRGVAPRLPPSHNILRLAAEGDPLYPIGVSPLKRFAALTPQHEALAELVRELEALWGDGPTLAEVAEASGLPPRLVRNSLVELDAAGVIVWAELIGVAYSLPAIPILGEVS